MQTSYTTSVVQKRVYTLAEPEEIRNDKNAKDYKKQMKVFHDKQIMRKSFAPG